jgi:hypothetical protein
MNISGETTEDARKGHFVFLPVCVQASMKEIAVIKFDVPQGGNLVLSAYEEIMGQAASQSSDQINHLVEQYARLFSAAPQPVQDVTPVSERFSLVDPTIKIGISSTITAA